jgi:hypothetical protein
MFCFYRVLIQDGGLRITPDCFIGQDHRFFVRLEANASVGIIDSCGRVLNANRGWIDEEGKFHVKGEND